MSDMELQAKEIGKTGHQAQGHSRRIRHRHQHFAQHIADSKQMGKAPHWKVMVIGSPSPKEHSFTEKGKSFDSRLEFVQAAKSQGMDRSTIWIVEHYGYQRAGIPDETVRKEAAGVGKFVWLEKGASLAAELNKLENGSIHQMHVYSHGLRGIVALGHGWGGDYGFDEKDAAKLDAKKFADDADIELDSCNSAISPVFMGSKSAAQALADQIGLPVRAWTGRTAYADITRGGSRVRGSQIGGWDAFSEILSRMAAWDLPHLTIVRPHKLRPRASRPTGSSEIKANALPFVVPQGQLTFDSEGKEGGAFHTRKAHWPGGNSGVTIGRGYDLGQHKAEQIAADMTASGIAEADAKKFALAAGKKGRAAKAFLATHTSDLPEITPEQQKSLFERTYREHDRDVRRISNAYAVYKEKKGKAGAHTAGQSSQNVAWDTLHPALHDLLVDLRFRGDYTPRSRAFLQPLIIHNDLSGVQRVMGDRRLWPGVPKDRFQRRMEFINHAAAEERAGRTAQKPKTSPTASRSWLGPLLASALALPGASDHAAASQYSPSAVSQTAVANRSLEMLMAKPHLTAAEIGQARQMIAQEKNQTKRGDLFERLQSKTFYHNQRDNFTPASKEDKAGNTWLDTKKNGKITAGDIMCNETSLAMDLEMLGIGNPDENGHAQFEDYLESQRVARKLGKRTATGTLGSLAAALGAKYTQVGPIRQGEAWWEENAKTELRHGHSMMLSVGGHIVRLQGVNTQGLVVDDPYGKITFFDDKKTVPAGVSAKIKARGWGHNYSTTETDAETKKKQSVRHDSRNTMDEKATEWAGAGNVWSWADVGRHNMQWVSTFYPDAESKQPGFKLAPAFETARTRSAVHRDGKSPKHLTAQHSTAGKAGAPANTLKIPVAGGKIKPSKPLVAALSAAPNPAGKQAASNKIQRKGDGAHPDTDPTSLRDSLLRQGGTGVTPDTNLRGRLSGHLGFDPAGARLHRGPAAAAAARSLNAEAFTIGKDVFFGEGRFDPSSSKGLGLIAHELTHVGQQTGTTGDKTRFYTQSGGDEMEQEARQAEQRVLAQAGSPMGLLVENYVRTYEGEDGATLSRSDQQRLDKISLLALQEAEKMLTAQGMNGADLASISIDVALDLNAMSDTEAAKTWACSIINGCGSGSERLALSHQAGIQRSSLDPPQTAPETVAGLRRIGESYNFEVTLPYQKGIEYDEENRRGIEKYLLWRLAEAPAEESSRVLSKTLEWLEARHLAEDAAQTKASGITTITVHGHAVHNGKIRVSIDRGMYGAIERFIYRRPAPSAKEGSAGAAQAGAGELSASAGDPAETLRVKMPALKVASMSTLDKVTEAMARSLPKLPGSMAEEIEQQLPMFALMIVILCGVQFIPFLDAAVDVIMFAAGIYFLGSQFVEVVNKCVSFYTAANSAQDDAGLDKAAAIFANIVSEVLVTILLALAGGKLVKYAKGKAKVIRARGGKAVMEPAPPEIPDKPPVDAEGLPESANDNGNGSKSPAVPDDTVSPLPAGTYEYIPAETNASGVTVKGARGELRLVDKADRLRSKGSQSKVSKGSGDDAGHYFADRFGGSGKAENLGRQNWIQNRAGGTWFEMEMEWENKLKSGWRIKATVMEAMRAGERRPYKRKVTWTEIDPDGKLTSHERIFANTETPKSRASGGIKPAVTGQTNNVVRGPESWWSQTDALDSTDPPVCRKASDGHFDDSGSHETAAQAVEKAVVTGMAPSLYRPLNNLINTPSVMRRKADKATHLLSRLLEGDPLLNECFHNQRLLNAGSSGESVKKIQRALLTLGFPMPAFGVDGRFGKETTGAVMAFQRQNGLNADGKIGYQTIASLDALLTAKTPAHLPAASPAPGVPPAPSVTPQIEVRATHIGGILAHAPVWHTLIVTTDNKGGKTFYRGGPGGLGMPGSPYGTIVSTMGPFVPGSIDWDTSSPMTPLVMGAGALGKDASLAAELMRIDGLHIPYAPTGPNSNTVTSTLLHKTGLPHRKPVMIAPGFNDHDL